MVSSPHTGAHAMTLLQVFQSWAKQTFHLAPDDVDLCGDDPLNEVNESIERSRRTRQEFIQELKHHEKADVAGALLRARERATLP